MQESSGFKLFQIYYQSIMYLNVLPLFDESEILKGVVDLCYAEKETTNADLLSTQ